ncbi:MAG: polysaccharide biosynthesis/export family protein [Bryobacteraceae bacterium]|nr:polysaccharide biosynthesis/export family protein [Bryobacteraceae bacterium]
MFSRSIVRFAGLAAAALALTLGLTAQQDRNRQPQGVRIGPEDTVSIYALGAEEISKNWRVGVSGDIILPMLGPIKAAGLSTEELEQVLSQRLKQYIKEPHVSVFIAEFRSQPVTVVGAVNKPGTLQMEGAKTLFDILIRAGGPKDSGPAVTVTRSLSVGPISFPGAHPSPDGKYSVVELDLPEVMEGRGAAANLTVFPLDVISVSEKKQPKLIHISGEVHRPGSVELVTQESVSLMKVLALAGGLTSTASPKRTMIMHVNAEGKQTSQAVIDLEKTMKGKAKDVELVSGDIVIIPSSRMTTYIQSATTSAISAGIFTLGRF